LKWAGILLLIVVLSCCIQGQNVQEQTTPMSEKKEADVYLPPPPNGWEFKLYREIVINRGSFSYRQTHGEYSHNNTVISIYIYSPDSQEGFEILTRELGIGREEFMKLPAKKEEYENPKISELRYSKDSKIFLIRVENGELSLAEEFGRAIIENRDVDLSTALEKEEEMEVPEEVEEEPKWREEIEKAEEEIKKEEISKKKEEVGRKPGREISERISEMPSIDGDEFFVYELTQVIGDREEKMKLTYQFTDSYNTTVQIDLTVQGKSGSKIKIKVKWDWKENVILDSKYEIMGEEKTYVLAPQFRAPLRYQEEIEFGRVYAGGRVLTKKEELRLPIGRMECFVVRGWGWRLWVSPEVELPVKVEVETKEVKATLIMKDKG